MATAIEIIDLDIKLRHQKQEKIEKKAEELFRIFSDSMIAQGVNYWNDFKHMNQKSKNSWFKVAESIVGNETTP